MTIRKKHTNTNVKLTDEQVIRIHYLRQEDNDLILNIRNKRDRRVLSSGMTLEGFRLRVNYLKELDIITQ